MFERYTNSLIISPSLIPSMITSRIRQQRTLDKRVLFMCGISITLGLCATFIALTLTRLIGFFTNLFFYHRLAFDFIDPGLAPNWGYWVIVVPVIGGIIVGLMARYGSKAIRGHGIPEAMEQILTNESRIPWRIVFLKPLSAAVAIGSGGPFGAEGPIIATGGALGSWIGQILKTTAIERKTLLAAGAAAGMTATFGSPISALLLAVELLLFEFRPRSFLPVALACVTASSARVFIQGGIHYAFSMPSLDVAQPLAVVFYALMGILIGLAAVFVTRVVYRIEDGFEELPIHWMWWPAIGGLVVGLIGYYFPKTLGVGYSNIDDILSNRLTIDFIAIFCLMKFISWSISLGSGTSGGTLAPIFTIGGGLGVITGVIGQLAFPSLQIDLKACALVGMAALFAGASRALLASVVFAFETTGQQIGLLPLLAGCSVSYLISSYLMKNTIMTEKIVRRGVLVPHEYAADALASKNVLNAATTSLVKLSAEMSIADAIDFINSHNYTYQAYPLVDEKNKLVGVLSRKDIIKNSEKISKLIELVKKSPIYIYEQDNIRTALQCINREKVGRLIVVNNLLQPLAILTRTDLLHAIGRAED